ncbi:ATP-binding protein [Geomesophilobacter sediminis]|uniref:histidine kinase n=1 Tax=Geomesophilobacter sediminis TaxID=2798584 RepID=A0A8J7S9C6_9BACT|nr:ATP-binding protein [Geomesophilobacter sediminis]MBJ6726861.1 response regulator [Geomesophilobacter sediminis]
MVGNPIFGRMSKHWVFPIASRINNPDGSFAGVVFGAISVDYIARIFSTFELGQHGVITLRNEALQVLVRYPTANSTGSMTVSSQLKALRQAGVNSGTYKTPGSIDAVERTFSYNKVSSYPLFVNVGRASGDYFAGWRSDVKMLAMLVTLFSAGSALSAGLLYRNRRQREASATELVQYREHLEETVRLRTSELERKNLLLAEEITYRQQAEADLEKAAIIMERMSDAVYWIARDGRIVYVNEAATRMHRFLREELLQKAIWEITPHFPKEMWPKHWEELKRDGCLQFETENLRNDGKTFPVEVVATYLNVDGTEYNCAIVRDISERREAEAEKQSLMVQLAQSQKMESVGRLAGGIAHDFNNLLTPILGYAELLSMNLPRESREHDRITMIHQAADKAKALTQQLLSFSRKQILEMKVIDLNEVVTSFYNILRRTIRENIAIRLHLTGDVLGIRADKNQIEQIIMNLAINAQDAVAETGVITIETAPVQLDAEYVRQHAGVKAGEYLMLAVTDSGSGMDQETLAHMFEPFYTTKEVGQGSGLGLATVYGLVNQHGGYVYVYSEVGKGTAFKIYFPVVHEKPVAERERSQAVSFNGSGRTILLVEDNDMVRELTCDFLKSFGAEIIVATSPKHALAISAGQQIDLLVTDVIMPEMNGPQLHRKLLELHPGLKVLYMSGYTNNAIVHHGVLDSGVNFLQKPFTVQDLASKVKAVLAS